MGEHDDDFAAGWQTALSGPRPPEPEPVNVEEMTIDGQRYVFRGIDPAVIILDDLYEEKSASKKSPIEEWIGRIAEDLSRERERELLEGLIRAGVIEVPRPGLGKLRELLEDFEEAIAPVVEATKKVSKSFEAFGETMLEHFRCRCVIPEDGLFRPGLGESVWKVRRRERLARKAEAKAREAELPWPRPHPPINARGVLLGPSGSVLGTGALGRPGPDDVRADASQIERRVPGRGRRGTRASRGAPRTSRK